MLSDELGQKEREYSELEEEWKAEKASLSGTQNIKAELEQAKITLEQARRVGDLGRMSELQYGKSLSWKNSSPPPRRPKARA